ncbi:flagellar protein FlaG [Massilia sp. TS11]|uniref:flagellar protein FlaG n=1 Tax=Massilia sp. TS11 TaxID=2908003 RepID=UPI001EDA35C1|nr:flagellar protein FlaG [Massilia sp. TS11]MCG2582889.1 flagellar protein FlaG [Massilia sp. TS11]
MSIQSISAAPARVADRSFGGGDVPVQAPARAPAAATDTATAVEKSAAAPSVEQVKQAVSNINKSLQTLSQDLEFSVDADSNRTIVKVVDQKTKEVIRQIPSQEALEIAKALDSVQGLLIKQTA